jgi:hypothetical protein
MNRSFNLLMAGLLGAVVLIFAFGPWRVLPGLKFQADMLEAGASVAGALFVIALFIERSMATVNALVWGERLRQAEMRLAANSADKQARAAAEDLMTKRERLRLLLAFIVGVLVAGAGVRALEGLLQTEGARLDRLFYPVDVLLTAGLLAGGSNGIAFLIQLLKDRAAPPPDPATPNQARFTSTG